MNNNCLTIENNTNTIEINNNFVAKGTLNNELKNLFKKAATQYNIDWKWLAAMAYVESGWRTSVKNKDGFFGLFQYKQKTITAVLGPGYNYQNAEHQALAASKNMSLNFTRAKKLGFDNESAYLYAGICHNAGIGGAKWAYDNANPKTIVGMQQALLTCDGGYGPHGNKVNWFNVSPIKANKQSKEKAEYPIKMKSAYSGIKD